MRSLHIKAWFIKKLLSAYLDIVYYTSKIDVVGLENYHNAKAESPLGTCILPVWHNNIFLFFAGKFQFPFCSLISPSSHGDIAAHLFQRNGGKAIRGSSFKGKRKEILETLGWQLQHGLDTNIPVDGSKGPIYIPKPGTCILASHHGVPIVPTCITGSAKVILKKVWDRHRFPLPFGYITLHIGEPMWVKPGISKEELPDLNEELAQRLFALDPELKSLCVRL